MKRTTRINTLSTTTMTTTMAAALALTLGTLSLGAQEAQAEITQDCILEGTVDLRAAERLGQPTYIKFRRAKRGTEAGCAMSRKSSSRRVQFISNPDPSEVQNVSHGTTVRYRYQEHNGRQGHWQLIEVVDNSTI